MNARFDGSEEVVLAGTAYVHPSALIYGRVDIGSEASVWCYATIRAEDHAVVIGRRTNIQDFVMIHVGEGAGVAIVEDCSITHRATLHGCTIGDRVLVGIGATIMDGCVVGDNSIIAGHSFLKEGTVIPANSIVMGTPASVRAIRDCGPANTYNAWLYQQNALAYARGNVRFLSSRDFGDLAFSKRRELDLLESSKAIDSRIDRR